MRSSPTRSSSAIFSSVAACPCSGSGCPMLVWWYCFRATTSFLTTCLPLDGTRPLACARDLVPSVDRFVVNSQFYADKMGDLLAIPPDQIRVTPLSIDLRPFQDLAPQSSRQDRNEFRLGYMARVAPEKGLHHLVESFIRLAGQPSHQDLSLHVAGWLGENNRSLL